jgi:hypothetical protein
LFSIPAVGASPHTDIQHPIYFQELEQGFAYDSKADMFGLGCLGFELARLRSGLIFFLFRMSWSYFACLLTRSLSSSLIRLLGSFRPPIISSLKAPQRAFTLMLPAPYSSDLCQIVGDLLKSNVRRHLTQTDERRDGWLAVCLDRSLLTLLQPRRRPFASTLLASPAVSSWLRLSKLHPCVSFAGYPFDFLYLPFALLAELALL